MSNRVMQPATFAPAVQPAGGLLLQRKCAACNNHTVAGGSCSGCAKEKESLQRRTAGSEATTEIPPIVNEVLHSPGQSLDSATRAFMEPRFHHDFSNVRVHADAKAAASATAINAHAYTVGSHIVFGAGQFAPATKAGQNLLAHELTHVLQQSHGLTRASASGIGPANDEHERQADAVANAITGTPAKPAAQTIRPLIPGSHQTVPSSVGPPAPRRRLQRRTDDPFADAFEDGGISQAAAQETAEPSGNCPKVPTKLGDQIPNPQCPTATHTGTTELLRFNFCLDSDQLTNPDQLNVITATLRRFHRGTRYLIHGYASPEGRRDYNFRLACHRAIKIADAFRRALRGRLRTSQMDEMMLDAEVESRLETASQGPTNEFGTPEANRVAVVYAQIPGRSEKEPGCDEAPRRLGEIEPEINCDLARTEVDHTTTGPQLAQFHFCLDSDVFSGSNPTDIRSFAHGQAANTNFIIHAFSSVEGPTDYNRRLSCHRALRLFRELINAGVQEQQITEVSGLGETKKFGEPEKNRVGVVFAQRGAVSEIPGGKRPASTRAEKIAIRDAAIARIMAGQYQLGADAYISFWTCGRTATVRQAVERLTIEVSESDSNNRQREVANGVEEGLGVNFVSLSNVALRADNAIECVMGRIIDSSFHHAVLGNPDLPADLTTPFDARAKKDDSASDRNNKVARHQAGLHLIHLAGLSKCEGRNARARVERGTELTGIDEPLVDDPRAGMPAPLCATGPQPTRLHPPAAGSNQRQAPTFELIGTPEYTPFRGSLENNFESAGLRENKNNIVTDPDRSMLIPSATVQLRGQPETFKDYEVGFIQNVIDDETQVDYDSGHSVIQKLPTPIRLAELRGEPLVAPPWTTSNAMARPDANGRVEVRATNSGLNTEVATALRRLNSSLPNAAFQEFNRDTRIAIWLVARRLGAPLDRFSVRFIDGVTYSVMQHLALEHRRVKGELAQTADPGTEEHELPMLVGGFLTSQPSAMPEDFSTARFLGPNANEIRVFNQVRNIVEPEAATDADMDKEQLRRAVQDILDNIEIFESDEMARLNIREKIQPRLGFDFIPLTIKMPFVRTTGRLENTDPENPKIVITITGPGLGTDAAHSMARALEFRIRTRTAVNERIKVRRTIIPGTGDVGTVEVVIPPVPRGPNADPRTESELINRADVRANMAEAWACTEFLKDPEFLEVGEREFGRAFMMDREKTITPVPSDRLEMGEKNDRGAFTLFLPCLQPVDKVALGHFHTHPETDTPPKPSEADFKYARDCGGQHFIITENKAFRYDGEGNVQQQGTPLPKAPGCRKINLERLKIID